MMSDQAAIYRQRWQLALDNTGHFPWRTTDLGPGIELRWLPSEPVHGEYLMTFATLLSRPESPLLSKVWIGMSAEDHAEAVAVIRQWRETTEPALLATVGSLIIIVGPDLREVTAELCESAAFVAANPHSPGKLAFLLCITYPQPTRNRQGEVHWLQSALRHELEHVWQYLAVGSPRLEPAWKSVAEMCSVHAETRHDERRNAVLDFGGDFLRRLPEGLLAGSLSSGGEHSCWCFPFVKHLEKACPGICRSLWKAKRNSGKEGSEKGPWLCLDDLLRACGTTLVEQWCSFCQQALRPSDDTVLADIGSRFPARFPSLFLDLAVQTVDTHYDQREFRPLSAHLVTVRMHPGSRWTLGWKITQLSEVSQVFVAVAATGGPWRELQNCRQDCEGGIDLMMDDPIVDILFVHASLPDLRWLYKSTSDHPYALDPAQLQLSIIATP